VCGIIAYFLKQPGDYDRLVVSAMAADIRHRGPDDEGFLFHDWFALGHRRLSVIDLSKDGRQPMFSDCKRYVIVYNGELYNFKALKQELLAKGYRFRSRTDTEVVLNAYIAWGRQCLKRFVGMFAFVIVDLKENRAFVARDPLGIKPLYYIDGGPWLALASEIKSLRHVTRFTLNPEALYEQLMYRYVSGRRTLFRDIHRVPAGSLIQVSRNGPIEFQAYYDIGEALARCSRSVLPLHEMEQRLVASIGQHTVSDVGFNIQLSGGVDSSYITAVLAREFGRQLHTFSVTLDDSIYDESPYQKAVTESCGTIHHSMAVGASDLADLLVKATWHMDMPIVHTSCVFLMALCRQARKHSKVMLTGEGADELFGGYGRYVVALKDRLAYRLKQFGLKPGMLPDCWKFKGLKQLLGRDLGIDAAMNMPPETLTLLQPLAKNLAYRRRVAERFPDILRKIIISDQTSYLESLLERQDRMSMAASVETRVPYCVNSLFDFVNRHDPCQKIQPLPKMVLKKICEKYFDRSFIYRPKNGFLLPQARWLRDRKSFGRYLDLLTDSTFRQRGYYDHSAVSRAVDDHLKERRDWDKELINLIKFEVWHRIFIDRQGVAAV